jgi:hypothetical protein
MTPHEIQEYHKLLDKRDAGTLTDLEYNKYLLLMIKSFNESIPTIVKIWKDDFEV